MDLSFLKFQLKFSKVFAITVSWQIVALLNTLYMFAYVSSVVDVEVPYNLPRSLLYSFIIASLGGFLFGFLEVFYMKSLLRKKAFGFVPGFKAGFNHGEVMAGEIGLVKRDLVFSGDVLNTGARIQEKCNVYGVDNLISSGLIKFIGLPDEMTCEKVDDITLRGKKSKVKLYTVKST